MRTLHAHYLAAANMIMTNNDECFNMLMLTMRLLFLLNSSLHWRMRSTLPSCFRSIVVHLATQPFVKALAGRGEPENLR